mmetsp:Transcript_54863/g.100172  ORF Transcript_54863/g.100172 Transcript_54863/m.100172 type:complete len:384 (-) Transcript_54863:45-1196(-)
MTLDARNSAVMATLETSLAEGLLLAFASNVACAVVLADPTRFDCPMINCSDGFENLTGYSKSEARGRNLRFLNNGVTMMPQMRKALRSASETGIEFMGIMPNMRKNGETFRMLLHIASVTANGHWYIMGIQADVTDVALDLTDALHIDQLRRVAEPIFSANVDACVQLPGKKFIGQHVKNVRPDQSMALHSCHPVKDSIDCILNDYAKVLFKHAASPSEEGPSKSTRAGCTKSPSSIHTEVPSKSTSADSMTGLSPILSSSSWDEACLITDIGESSDQADIGESSDQANTSGIESSWSNQTPSDAGEARQSRPLELNRILFAPFPKSVGSVCHPDRCTPCKFYFGARGCRHGTDCRMCHEPHPTKGSPKCGGPKSKIHTRSCP